MAEFMVILLVLAVVAVLLSGFPVAFAYAGTSLLFSFIGIYFLTDIFDPAFLNTTHNKLFALMMKDELMAVPLFVFMGVMLERSRVAEDLLDTMGMLFGSLRGGLGISVTLVGMLLAASTGIVGATIVTMGLLSLPTMLKRNYDPSLAAGTICASGTLGQIIPPSIILILLADQLSSEYANAQLEMGRFESVNFGPGEFFAGALIPGLLLVALYILYLIVIAFFQPERMPAIPAAERNFSRKQLYIRAIKVLLPPLSLIIAVLGSILYGLASPTLSASVGAVGAIVLALLHRRLNIERLNEVMRTTLRISAMVFLIFIGAAIFTATFRGFGGDQMVAQLLSNLPGGIVGAIFVVMLVVFLLGFIIDFIEISLVVIPIVAPVLFKMAADPASPLDIDLFPIWLGIMFAVNLQTSFLTPPFGFALFYLRGVAPPQVTTAHIYKGVVPFIFLQLLALFIVAFWPELATWLPMKMQAP